MWQGQVYTANFPIPIMTFEGDEIGGINFKFGVSVAFLKISQDRPPVWDELDLRIRRGDGLAAFRRHSFIEHGDAFIAEVELL